jgi:hypothetical protein
MLFSRQDAQGDANTRHLCRGKNYTKVLTRFTAGVRCGFSLKANNLLPVTRTSLVLLDGWPEVPRSGTVTKTDPSDALRQLDQNRSRGTSTRSPS